MQKNPSSAIYLHLMQIIFQICLRSDFVHVRMHSLAQQEHRPQQRPQGLNVKTTTQQQMTTQRPARGLSLLACSLLASLPVALLAALQSVSEAASKGLGALAAAANHARRPLPASYHHQHDDQWPAFFGAHWEPGNNIRGGNP
ncbi:hypothetical protein EJB06_08960 [Massilia atriviolacea]|uniref:Uncharacterized protein n=1 Tax=Massilia atriviolacea TaxID=2495579 RepID=A0A430HP56_9BURK|nr:hypothetical protein EJB06_08960 [Massilia atriviolacea]